jgi:3-hydroxyacyl-CoA dehydrogenase
MNAEPADTSSTIRTVGVIGVGTMGQGIAAANLRAGRTVLLCDRTPEEARRGTERVLDDLGPCGGGIERALSAVRTDAELGPCDLIIEAVTESLPVKRRVLAGVEPHISPRAIVASNTSSLRIGAIAAGMQGPERCCALHFCHPVRSRRLVEVVGSTETHAGTIDAANAYVRSLGKLPIFVADRPGFIVNRLLMAYFSAAQQLLQEGVPIRSIESAAREFGLECGPFSLMDGFGIDVTARAGRHLAAAFPDRAGNREVLRFLYERGFLGRKSGAGFFLYANNGSQGEVNPEIQFLIRRPVGDRAQPAAAQLLERLLLPMLGEARRLLEEQVACDAGDVDVATVHGFGFPESTGGLLAWANTVNRTVPV